MARVTAVFVLAAVVLTACADDGAEDTGFADATSGAPTTTTAPGDSGDDTSTTGSSFTCDANVEFVFADGVELGAQSVDIVRLEIAGDTQYTVSIVGDAAGTTQLDIVFVGTPVVGMAYTPTAFMQLGQPQVSLLPPLEGELDLQGGTITYTTVGTAQGDVVALALDLQFMRGTIAGCVHTELTVQTG